MPQDEQDLVKRVTTRFVLAFACGLRRFLKSSKSATATRYFGRPHNFAVTFTADNSPDRIHDKTLSGLTPNRLATCGGVRQSVLSLGSNRPFFQVRDVLDIFLFQDTLSGRGGTATASQKVLAEYHREISAVGGCDSKTPNNVKGRMGKLPRVWENFGLGGLIIVICGTRTIQLLRPYRRPEATGC